jgi:phosphatidylinositol alpha-1,6-mannosyltransferase
MTRNTLLLVTRNFPPANGGIETMAWELARLGAKAGHDIVLLHVGQKACAQPPEGVRKYHHLPGTNRWIAWKLSAIAVPFLALRYRAACILHMQVNTGLGGLIARRLFGIPYIVVGLGLELLPGRARWYHALRASILKGARKVVSISRFTDGLVAAFGVASGSRLVINPGTRLWAQPPEKKRAALFGDGDDVFVCLSLSRLVARKGIDKVLEALPLVLAKRSDILYCVAGGGPDLARLQGIVAEKGLGKHVRFLGRIDDEDLGSCYASADLFVLPSRESKNPPDAEGFGIVFLEAGACGTPSLGGASGGVPDAILDGKTGLLADPENPSAIAEKILLLMEDRSRLRSLGVAAKAHAEEQAWDKVAARYFAAILS